VGRASQTITQMRVTALISLGLLFIFGLALAWVVYRDMIAPLRVKLVESQALMERQEKLVSLGMLAAGVAHEIRNPLTAIKAALFIQQKKFRAGTQEFDDARLVEREILRLERIVNDFLLFARPAEPEMANLTPAALFQEIQSLFGHSLAGNHIQLRIEESPPLRIRADAAQIKQVLINLVQNAADAIGRDGVITLRARRDRKRLANVDTNVVVLEVVDDGKGIPPEVQQRLFDPFFTTKDSGTGLGLSIAAGIVQKHGGALQYQTQLDYGTTFGILLLEPTE
jgi:signal transduction histidine kinase